MNESDLQRFSNYSIYPRSSKIYSYKGFVNIDNGSQGASHWTCFTTKENKSYCFASFGVQPDKLLLSQIPKSKIYHIYKIQGIESKVCGSFSLKFFYLIERMKHYDVILKMYFD